MADVASVFRNHVVVDPPQGHLTKLFMYESVLERSFRYGRAGCVPLGHESLHVGLCLPGFSLVECSVRSIWPCVHLWDLLSSEVATKPGPFCISKMANYSQ